MAKKIRFSLEMKDGVEVRTLEELQDNFSLEKVLFYISNGKMQTWLRDRYHNDIADSIEQLDSSDPEYNKNICGFFGVEYDESELEDLEKAKERNRKLELLKQFTDNQEILDNAYFTAFEQDDIYDLLDEGAEKIYLCGERFSIPLSVSGVTYIGVNNPIAVISSKTVVDWNEKNISISGVRFDDKYQTLFRTKENNEKAELEARIRAEEEARIRVEMESMRQTERGSYNTESKTIKKEVDVGRYVLSFKDMILGPPSKNTDENPQTDTVNREPYFDEWKCPDCGTINHDYVSTCACGCTQRRAKRLLFKSNSDNDSSQLMPNYNPQQEIPISGFNPFKKKVVYKQTFSGEWQCPKCGIVNAGYVTTCACGARKERQSD